MKAENAIEVHEIKKNFKVYLDKGRTMKERVLFKNRRAYEIRNVLDGISFEVKKGEAIGLIGHNGCGKSTTLKMLTKIIYPNSGSIEMDGRVSSLIELGAGFHPDLSGRENIYTNASIFGLTKKEIDDRLNDIIEFSELRAFIDNPVRTYSSGMYMRLAFSVAINVDADILLIDEILAVGDVSFQNKCFNKLKELKRRGLTIVVVSHSLGQIEQLCDRSIWINHGRIAAEGIPRDIHSQYLAYMAGGKGTLEAAKPQEEQEKSQRDENTIEDVGSNINADEAQKRNMKRWGNGNAKISRIWMENSEGKATTNFITGEEMNIFIEYKSFIEVPNPVIGIGFWSVSGERFYGSNTLMDGIKGIGFGENQQYILKYTIKNIPFLTGEYQLEAALEDLDTAKQLDYWLDAKHFNVSTTTGEVGIVKVDHDWNISSV